MFSAIPQFMQPAADFLRSLSPAQYAIIVGGSIGFSVLAAAATVWFMLRLPPDYFYDPQSRAVWRHRHPLLRWTAFVAKNLFGLAVFAIGAVMIVPGVPGPGLIAMILGITLVDFPGKFAIERSIVSKPAVLSRLNGFRVKHGREPFQVHEKDAEPLNSSAA